MSAPNVIEIEIDKIKIGKRLRPLHEGAVASLAESIRESGLQSPIGVTLFEQRLVWGAHRVAAFRVLGLTEISAVMVAPVDELHFELAEVDENLVRHELNILERAAHLARRKELYEAIHPETKHGGVRDQDPESGSCPSFLDATAEATGRSRAVIAEEVRIASAIAPDVKDTIAGTEIANSKTVLVKLSKLPPEEQREVVASPDPKAALASKMPVARRVAAKPVSVSVDPVKSAEPSAAPSTSTQPDHVPTADVDDIDDKEEEDSSVSLQLDNLVEALEDTELFFTEEIDSLFTLSKSGDVPQVLREQFDRVMRAFAEVARHTAPAPAAGAVLPVVDLRDDAQALTAQQWSDLKKQINDLLSAIPPRLWRGRGRLAVAYRALDATVRGVGR